MSLPTSWSTVKASLYQGMEQLHEIDMRDVCGDACAETLHEYPAIATFVLSSIVGVACAVIANGICKVGTSLIGRCCQRGDHDYDGAESSAPAPYSSRRGRSHSPEVQEVAQSRCSRLFSWIFSCLKNTKENELDGAESSSPARVPPDSRERSISPIPPEGDDELMSESALESGSDSDGVDGSYPKSAERDNNEEAEAMRSPIHLISGTMEDPASAEELLSLSYSGKVGRAVEKANAKREEVSERRRSRRLKSRANGK